MIAAVDAWTGVRPPTRDNEADRLLFLLEYLEEFGFYGDYIQVINWHGDYEAHGLYPFGRGTWEDQPEWLLQDFRTLGLKRELVELQKKFRESEKGA